MTTFLNNTVLNNVFPILKRSTPVTDNSDSDIDIEEIPFEERPIMTEDIEGLTTFYAVDRNEQLVFLKNDLLTSNQEITIEQLKLLSLSNTHEYFKDSQFFGDPFTTGMRIKLDGSFESSIMLLDHFWNNLEQYFKTEFTVAIPQKDWLLVAQKLNSEATKGLLYPVIDFKAKAPHTTINHLFERSNSKWKIVLSV